MRIFQFLGEDFTGELSNVILNVPNEPMQTVFGQVIILMQKNGINSQMKKDF